MPTEIIICRVAVYYYIEWYALWQKGTLCRRAQTFGQTSHEKWLELVTLNQYWTNVAFQAWKYQLLNICLMTLLTGNELDGTVENCPVALAHKDQDKMASIVQISSNLFSWMKTVVFCFEFQWFCSYGPINNKSAYISILAWCRTDDKPLFK